MIRIKKLLFIIPFLVLTLMLSCSKDYYDTKDAGENFLIEVENIEGVEKLASGIRYKILFDNKHGSYPQYAEPNEISYKAKYSTRFIDGTVLTEEIEGVNPFSDVTFWLDVIPRMRVGAKWRVWVPYDYVYGEDGTSGVDPYTVLVYDIELIQAN